MVAVDLLVILDGASEPLTGARPTSLELARVPTLDRLAREGTLSRVRTVPAGLPAGSETAIPTLLGHTPTAPVDRAAIEAAGHGITVRDGERAWRIDVRDGEGGRGEREATERAAAQLARACSVHRVHRLSGHRLLLVGPEPLPAAACRPGLHVWPGGDRMPRALSPDVHVIGARGAAVGIAAAMGATPVTPLGATGDVDTDLTAKLDAAKAALDARPSLVAVHVGGADEAAHRRDARAKIAFLERTDRELLAPLADAVAVAGATLRVCADHGCDPQTGRHLADPVPHVTWPACGPATALGRFTERTVADLPVGAPPQLAAVLA